MVENKKNIAIFEDYPPTHERIQVVLEDAGYSVVVLATDIVQATRCVSKLEKLGVRAALVDSSLSECDYTDDDGEGIIKHIKRVAPSVRTVAFSIFESGIEGADFNAPKARFLSDEEELDGRLLEILEEIFAEK